MTIREAVIYLYQKRRESLEKIQAPNIMLESVDKSIAKIDALKGITEFGDLEVVSSRSAPGRGGKPYYVFETAQGNVFYFPLGRFGPFLKKE